MDSNKCMNKVERVAIYSPIGQIEIKACLSGGLHRIQQLGQQSIPDISIKVEIKDQSFSSNNKAINDSIEWLKTYFETPDKHLNVILPKLCPFEKHSEFYLKVWSKLMNETKFGQTISYSELAVKSIGNMNASRAVGTAMKNNPFQLIVPCHRVIKKNGMNGNYSGGHKNDLKDWLIKYEKSFSSN